MGSISDMGILHRDHQPCVPEYLAAELAQFNSFSGRQRGNQQFFPLLAGLRDHRIELLPLSAELDQVLTSLPRVNSPDNTSFHQQSVDNATDHHLVYADVIRNGMLCNVRPIMNNPDNPPFI